MCGKEWLIVLGRRFAYKPWYVNYVWEKTPMNDLYINIKVKAEGLDIANKIIEEETKLTSMYKVVITVC